MIMLFDQMAIRKILKPSAEEMRMNRGLSKRLGRNCYVGWSLEDVAKWPLRDKQETLAHALQSVRLAQRRINPLWPLQYDAAMQLAELITATLNVVRFHKRGR